jgi:tRNA (guanine10-N2)-dimethyltransferase
VVRVDRHADVATSVTSGVYVLELAGTDDEFAAYEAGCAASDVSVLAPGLATARGLTDRFDALAYTHRASELLGTCEPTVADAGRLLGASQLDRAGTAAVRAVDVRGTTEIDTQAVERELGDELVDRGFGIDLDDPDHELRALFAGETCALGWLAAETERDFAERRPPDRPFVQPGSMSAMLARALANMAGARPGATVLDPMCGTGGILVEAGLVGARAIGVDAQQKMAAGARENLAEYLDGDAVRDDGSPAAGDWGVVRGDAASLPVAPEEIDAVVFDTPYGRQSKIRGDLHQLVLDALREARRVASRCVVVGDRPWAQPAASAGWTTEAAFDRRVHRSLTRYIMVLRRR